MRLFGFILAGIGKLPKLRTLYLGGNRLQANSAATALPTFEYPEAMREIRLTPNGWQAGQPDDNLPRKRVDRMRPFDYANSSGTLVRQCVPAVWVDADTDTDNLAKWSRHSLRGKTYTRELAKSEADRNAAVEPRFVACTS